MFTGSHKDYRVTQHYQAEMREAADRARLAQTADVEPEGSTFNSKRWIMIGIVIVLTVLTLFAGFQRVHAQDEVTPGGGEFFHDARLAYSVGIYFLNKGDYDRAVEKLSEAVALMPEWAFQVEPAYADMYWTLGEAQEGAGLYEDALVSYRQFHGVVGDEAAPWTFVKVQELQAEVDALLVEDTRL